MSISNNLKRLRQEQNLTQEQVAERLGVTRQAVSGYESDRTRPDVDTLMRLAEIYGTDLDGVLYGREREQKTLRGIKTAAWVLLGISVFLALLGAVLLWTANMFFAIPEGPVSNAMMQVWVKRQTLMHVCIAAEGIQRYLTLTGPVLLIILMIALRCIISWDKKLIYAGIWLAAVWVVTLPFSLTDPVYGQANYHLILWSVTIHIVFYLLIALAVDFFRARRPKGKIE